MTRRAGFVQVQLLRVDAERIAAWVLTLSPPEPTILGSAGLSDEEIQREARAWRNQMRELSACLIPRRRGRPRMQASDYHVPRHALVLLDKRYVAAQAPADIRRAISALVASSRRRRGVRLSLDDRRRNVRNAGLSGYQPETIRNYERRIRQAEANERATAAEALRLADEIKRRPDLRAVIFAWAAGTLQFD